LKLRGSFDVVHAAHTLEHVKDPFLFLGKLKSFLKPGGRLLIEVPNAYHLWALLWHYGPRLKGRTAPLRYAKEHTFDFSKATLATVMEKAGCRVLNLRTYEYPTGILNLKQKDDDNFLKAALRPAWVRLAKALNLEARLGSYLQVLAEAN
jgi:2-polyprenyl-3-methyl-5-hydroxy-6-metoxy-1,4-benzoquinol methylase